MKLSPSDEPAVYTGGVLGLFAALVVLATQFGLIDWTTEQTLAVATVATIALPWLQGVITRQFVRPASLSVPKPSPAAPFGECPYDGDTP